MRDPGPGRAVYSDYIQAELEAQDARKASFEQRGLAVISTSGLLVSLLFALAALVTSRTGYVLPDGARRALYVALFLFVLAAVAALVVNAPLKYKYVKAAELRRAVTSLWDDTEAVAQSNVAHTRVDAYERLLARNQLKGRILIAAIGAEVAAVGIVAFAIGIILRHG